MIVTILSFWRNDAHRHLARRAAHLCAKTSRTHTVRWLWVVGDSHDQTEDRLREHGQPGVTIRRYDTGIVGESVATRRQRLSAVATCAFAQLPESDYLCLHESDLRSPTAVVDDLLMSGNLPIAAWPIIHLPHGPQFYDIWAFRKDGVTFSPTPPYHACYTPGHPFQVDSFGSCWIAPTALVRQRVLEREAIVELCAAWRRERVALWVDPRVVVEQPTDVWDASPLE